MLADAATEIEISRTMLYKAAWLKEQGRSYNKEAAIAAYKEAVPVIDSMVNKGIVNKNKAARHKSRLNKRIKALVA